jgi:tetratricopeptide (TPR) repeat protein
MASNPNDPPATTAAGFAALKRGDANAARACFDRMVSAGAADAAVWYGLSLVNRSLGASAEENSALDQALALDPRHLPALIAKGDWFSRSGDRRAANSYYRAVIKLAAVTPSLPPEWRADIQRVEAASQRFARDYEEHLLAALAAGGLGGPGTERFAHAVDLLLGKREINYQQPKYFFFPGLPPSSSIAGSSPGPARSSGHRRASLRRCARSPKPERESSPIFSARRIGPASMSAACWTIRTGARFT